MMNNFNHRECSKLDQVGHLLSQLYSDRDLIASALEHAGNTHTFDDVAMLILQGKLIYWHLSNSCIVGEVVTSPQRKVLHFFLSAGDLNEITAMQPQMIKTAEMLGCSALSISGRPGWKKPLGELGWKYHSTTLWLDLDNLQPEENPIDLEQEELQFEAPEKENGHGQKLSGSGGSQATGGNSGSL